MRYTNAKIRSFAAATMFLAVLFAIACGPSGEEKLRQSIEKSLMPSNIPASIQNAAAAPDLQQDASNVVTISGGGYYVGHQEFPLDVLADRLGKSLKSGPEKTVDVQADYNANYGDIVNVLDAIRKAGGKDIALLVRPDERGEPKRFAISLHPEPTPDMNEDVSVPEIKLAKDGKLTIGKKDIGTVDSLDKLTDSLRSTATKTVNIRAVRSSRYADVVKVADAAKSGGASQVFLVIDDLVD